MSFDLLPQIIIIVSIGIIVIILGRNISKIKDMDNESLFFQETKNEQEKEKFFYLYSRIKERINREEYQKKIDLMWVWLEKTLRKIRISFLKIDNKIVLLLDKLREKQTEPEVEKEGQVDNAEKKAEEEKNNKEEFLKKEKSAAEDKSRDNKALENMASGGAVEIISKSEDKQKEIISSISEKENTKGKEKEYIKMILKNPIDIKAYWNLGVVYSRRRNYKDAISCFRQITKIDPTYFKAKKKISDLMERMKRKDKDRNKDGDKDKFGSENADAQKEEENGAQLTDNNEK